MGKAKSSFGRFHIMRFCGYNIIEVINTEDRRSHRSMNRKLGLLYALNIADWICTIALLRTGGFYEANPLMRPLIAEPLSGLLVKCFLPAALLISVCCLLRGLEAKDLFRVDRVVSFVLVLYSALCMIHISEFIMWRIC